jgi:hypothetical protein
VLDDVVIVQKVGFLDGARRQRQSVVDRVKEELIACDVTPQRQREGVAARGEPLVQGGANKPGDLASRPAQVLDELLVFLGPLRLALFVDLGD